MFLCVLALKDMIFFVIWLLFSCIDDLAQNLIHWLSLLIISAIVLTKVFLILLLCICLELLQVVMLGLDAAGKTTILYKLHIGEVLSTVPTIGELVSFAWSKQHFDFGLCAFSLLSYDAGYVTGLLRVLNFFFLTQVSMWRKSSTRMWCSQFGMLVAKKSSGPCGGITSTIPMDLYVCLPLCVVRYLFHRLFSHVVLEYSLIF